MFVISYKIVGTCACVCSVFSTIYIYILDDHYEKDIPLLRKHCPYDPYYRKRVVLLNDI